jgi:hypothetical protein
MLGNTRIERRWGDLVGFLLIVMNVEWQGVVCHLENWSFLNISIPEGKD